MSVKQNGSHMSGKRFAGLVLGRMSVTMLIIALGYAENTATQVAALIMGGAGVIAYIVGEGLADAGNVK